MQTHAHIHAQEKAQTSLLLIYAQGPSNLPTIVNKQQWNLRRYDKPSAQKRQTGMKSHTRRHLLLTLLLTELISEKKCSKLFVRQ